MADHVAGRDGMARQHAVADGFQLADLGFGKFVIAEFMARIDQLDPDRARIDVGMAAPMGYPGVPGALPFVHQSVNVAVFVDQVMGRDLGLGVDVDMHLGVEGQRRRLLGDRNGSAAL